MSDNLVVAQCKNAATQKCQPPYITHSHKIATTNPLIANSLDKKAFYTHAAICCICLMVHSGIVFKWNYGNHLWQLKSEFLLMQEILCAFINNSDSMVFSTRVVVISTCLSTGKKILGWLLLTLCWMFWIFSGGIKAAEIFLTGRKYMFKGISWERRNM